MGLPAALRAYSAARRQVRGLGVEAVMGGALEDDLTLWIESLENYLSNQQGGTDPRAAEIEKLASQWEKAGAHDEAAWIRLHTSADYIRNTARTCRAYIKHGKMDEVYGIRKRFERNRSHIQAVAGPTAHQARSQGGPLRKGGASSRSRRRGREARQMAAHPCRFRGREGERHAKGRPDCSGAPRGLGTASLSLEKISFKNRLTVPPLSVAQADISPCNATHGARGF